MNLPKVPLTPYRSYENSFNRKCDLCEEWIRIGDTVILDPDTNTPYCYDCGTEEAEQEGREIKQC